jgi:regulator of sirC expression with transglutaminase-like and TPR domain
MTRKRLDESMPLLARFAGELQQRDPEIERLALAIAGIEYPDVDVRGCLHDLDTLAAFVGQGLEAQPAGEDRAAYFLHAVHNELGFVGNHDDYYDPDNSYLNRVLVRRTGLPILLSVLCIALGRRLRVQIEGIGFPGHFMVQYRDAQGAWLLDVFHGKMLPVIEAEDYLSRLFNRAVYLPLDIFEPVSVESVAARILNNLRGVYLNRGDSVRAARVMDYLTVLDPKNPRFWQERGLLHHQAGNWEESARDLRRYFFLSGHLAALAQAVNLPESALEELSQQDRYLLSVLEEVEQTRSRLN